MNIKTCHFVDPLAFHPKTEKNCFYISVISNLKTLLRCLRVWKGGGGGPDPAFPPLFCENPASRTFFISFPNTAFLSQKNTLKSLISTKANKCKM